uniref:Uncharacterized protein n=1 Tax=Anguilla anguilla TaxID=7936 RepID=A0A0E9US97_ANGAN
MSVNSSKIQTFASCANAPHKTQTRGGNF